MSEAKTNRDEQLGEQEAVRREKTRKLAEAGVELFPHKIIMTHSIRDIVTAYTDQSAEELETAQVRVTVPGRILSLRKMGRAVFFHINDSEAKLQAYIRADKVSEEQFEQFSLLDIGDMVAIEGLLFKTRTGELTVLAAKWHFLAKCLHPLPEKWHGLQDVELRFRKRYLDLIVNPDTAHVFRLRGRMIAGIREFFDERGYVEVETPMMHAVPGGALAKPFQTFHNALDMELFLRIAPELYLKRLTVGGMNKVYEINRNFRNEGISTEHNPEFTMLEFYEAYADYNDMMAMTEELISGLARNLLGSDSLQYGESVISLKRPWKRIKFMDALAEFSGLAPSRFDDRGSIIELAAALAGEGTALTYGKALDVIFDKNVKPQIVQPTFITNPPKEISPLAKASPENPDEAQRFELMMAGMEIANAFSELTDPAEQRMRFEEQAEARKKGDEESHVIDEDYINALEYGLPPTGGQGIGIDRLVMLFANRRSIREVILFPLLRPRGT
jgi:lysyl-tRNA synthetase class 2